MLFNTSNILAYAEVISAIHRHDRVLTEIDDRLIEGTLRAITPAEDNPGFLPAGKDVSGAWVWITTVGGFETWVLLSALVTARSEGLVRLSGA